MAAAKEAKPLFAVSGRSLAAAACLVLAGSLLVAVCLLLFGAPPRSEAAAKAAVPCRPALRGRAPPHGAEAATERNLQSLHRYFDAVSATGLGGKDKLRLIADLFSEDAELVRPDGTTMHGRSGVAAFYGSPKSPVMQLQNFAPAPVNETMAFSDDGATIAVEISLPLPGGATSPVADFFSFDKRGLIRRLRIYSWPLA